MNNDLPPSADSGSNTGRNIFIGCAAAAVIAVLVAGIGGYLMFKKGTEAVQNIMKEEEAYSQAESSFVAPADDASAESLFPASIADHTRKSVSENATATPVDLTGRSATYEAPNGSDVRVWLVPAGNLTANDLHLRAGTYLDGQDTSSRVTTNLGNRFRFSANPPNITGFGWQVGNQLYYLETDNYKAKDSLIQFSKDLLPRIGKSTPAGEYE